MKEDANRDFKGIWIPKEIWETDDLNWIEKCLLAEIDSLSKGDGCYASNEYLASLFRVDTRTISHYVSNLRERGYISYTEILGKGRILRSNIVVAIYPTDGGRKLLPLRWKKASMDGGRKLLPIDKSIDKILSKDNIILEESSKRPELSSTLKTSETWNFAEEVQKCRTNKRRDVQIIGLWFQVAGYNFQNKEQYAAEFKRNLRPAKDLTGYTDEQIKETYKRIKKEHSFITKITLNTIGKYIAEQTTRKVDPAIAKLLNSKCRVEKR